MGKDQKEHEKRVLPKLVQRGEQRALARRGVSLLAQSREFNVYSRALITECPNQDFLK